MLEARAGFEPAHRGFADLCLTTWLPRHLPRDVTDAGRKAPVTGAVEKPWSGRRDLNPRLRPWQGRTLPLSYSRAKNDSTALAARGSIVIPARAVPPRAAQPAGSRDTSRRNLAASSGGVGLM